MKHELTNKCKEDFLDYYWKNYIGKNRFLNKKSETEEFFNSLYPVFINSLIVDFFIYRQIWSRIFYEEYRKKSFMNYEHSVNQSIIRCNEIYNNLNKY